ncbi:MAG: hypothetical protein R3301_02420 [Saprospiraceae bacterium]|nr:hypothetical protein [Saprospiraceae bacterium]
MRWILLIPLALGVVAVATAQSASPEAPAVPSAEQHIDWLAEGTLLVRLPANRSKMQAIEKALADETLSERARDRLVALLAETKEETAAQQQAYVTAFQDEYNFSDVGFFFDYDTPAVLEGWGNVYDFDLMSEKEISLDKPWYILSIGRTPESRVSGLVVLDHQLDPVPRPFPNSVITSGFAVIGAWLSADPAEHYFVRKLQKNLDRFSER